jgi:hypothetical protein
MRGESKDVVMGFASGYNAGQVVAFVHSLRAVGFNGTLVLGIESAQRHPVKSKELLKLFARCGLHTPHSTAVRSEPEPTCPSSLVGGEPLVAGRALADRGCRLCADAGTTCSRRTWAACD